MTIQQEKNILLQTILNISKSTNVFNLWSNWTGQFVKLVLYNKSYMIWQVHK